MLPEEAQVSIFSAGPAGAERLTRRPRRPTAGARLAVRTRRAARSRSPIRDRRRSRPSTSTVHSPGRRRVECAAAPCPRPSDDRADRIRRGRPATYRAVHVAIATAGIERTRQRLAGPDADRRPGQPRRYREPPSRPDVGPELAGDRIAALDGERGDRRVGCAPATAGGATASARARPARRGDGGRAPTAWHWPPTSPTQPPARRARAAHQQRDRRRAGRRHHRVALDRWTGTGAGTPPTSIVTTRDCCRR